MPLDSNWIWFQEVILWSLGTHYDQLKSNPNSPFAFPFGVVQMENWYLDVVLKIWPRELWIALDNIMLTEEWNKKVVKLQFLVYLPGCSGKLGVQTIWNHEINKKWCCKANKDELSRNANSVNALSHKNGDRSLQEVGPKASENRGSLIFRLVTSLLSHLQR